MRMTIFENKKGLLITAHGHIQIFQEDVCSLQAVSSAKEQGAVVVCLFFFDEVGEEARALERSGGSLF